MASYYDRVLEDFDMREGILDEGIYDEGIYDEGIYDEGVLDEAFRSGKKRPVRVQPSVGRPANFAKNVPGSTSQGNLVTKSELRNSLNNISTQVNDLKKSSLSLASSIKRLDEGYEKVIRGVAKKDRVQDNQMSSTTMMSLMGTLVNKPTLNTGAISYRDASGNAHPIEVAPGQDPIQVDLTKTLMFTMLPAMMSGSSGGDNSMMMLMMLMMTNRPGSGANGSDNTMMMMIPMMMMMMNKK